MTPSNGWQVNGSVSFDDIVAKCIQAVDGENQLRPTERVARVKSNVNWVVPYGKVTLTLALTLVADLSETLFNARHDGPVSAVDK